MRKHGFLHGLRIVLIVVVMCAAVGFAVMSLWNWLMPALFGLHTVTYWQALGLFVLAKILLGGFHRHGGRQRWGRQMRARWEQMTPEEQERFRTGMRGRRGCGFGPREETASMGTER